MDSKKIQKLIDAYFDGETSIDDERLLKDYFSKDDFNRQFAEVAPIFQFLKNEKAVEMPVQKTVALKAVRGGRSRAARWAMAASLGLALMAGGWLFQRNMAEEKHRAELRERLNRDTFEDPEKALAEVKAAFALVARKTEKGSRKAEKGLKRVKKLDIFSHTTKNSKQ